MPACAWSISADKCTCCGLSYFLFADFRLPCLSEMPTPLPEPDVDAEPLLQEDQQDDTDLASSTCTDATDLDPSVQRHLYWGLFYLSFVTLWAYQSLISAQHYYSTKFPEANLAFWGVVSLATAMFGAHIATVALGLDQWLGFTLRFVPSVVGFIAVGVALLLLHYTSVVVAAFTVVGVLMALSTSPLYGLAGLFPTPVFTQAITAGNGAAGFLNVTIETLIRLSLLWLDLRVDDTLVSFQVFNSCTLTLVPRAA